MRIFKQDLISKVLNSTIKLLKKKTTFHLAKKKKTTFQFLCVRRYGVVN